MAGVAKVSPANLTYMNIESAIFAYGTSEGATHAWDTRGRGKKDQDKDTEARRARAVKSHIPVTPEKLAIAYKREEAVAKAIGGTLTPKGAPFDVLKGKIGIEVKTIHPGSKRSKITVHKNSRLRKEAYVKSAKLKKTFTVILDERDHKVYVANGIGSFKLGKGNANVIPSLQSLRNHIK